MNKSCSSLAIERGLCYSVFILVCCGTFPDSGNYSYCCPVTAFPSMLPVEHKFPSLFHHISRKSRNVDSHASSSDLHDGVGLFCVVILASVKVDTGYNSEHYCIIITLTIRCECTRWYNVPALFSCCRQIL